MMLSYGFLAAAIVLELIATSILKYTEGFTRLYPTVGCIILYVLCFFCLARALMKMNLGIAYATWCGVGIVVSSLVSVLIYKEDLSLLGVVGIILVVAGCIILNLYGTAH